MADFNVSTLTPEEKQQLIAMLQAPDTGVDAGSLDSEGAGNPDAEQDESLIRAICAEMMAPLLDLVENVIIGGMEEAVKKKQQLVEVQQLREQFAEDFPDDTQKWYSDATDGLDLFDKLHEDVGGMAPEEQGPKVKEIAGSLKEKMMKLKGISPEAAAPVVEEATKVESAPANPKLDRVMRNIDALKKSGKNVGY